MKILFAAVGVGVQYTKACTIVDHRGEAQTSVVPRSTNQSVIIIKGTGERCLEFTQLKQNEIFQRANDMKWDLHTNF